MWGLAQARSRVWCRAVQRAAEVCVHVHVRVVRGARSWRCCGVGGCSLAMAVGGGQKQRGIKAGWRCSFYGGSHTELCAATEFAVHVGEAGVLRVWELEVRARVGR